MVKKRIIKLDNDGENTYNLKECITYTRENDCINIELNDYTSLSFMNYNNLIDLNCSYNQLTELNDLPDSLLYLNCRQNKLKKINLPPNLKTFECTHNQIERLKMPDSLEEVYCAYNQIKKITHISKSLKKFNCVNNKLMKLPPIPKDLIYLCVAGNINLSLPILNNNLKKLNCSSCKIEKIDYLPESLEYIYLTGNNRISKLPFIKQKLNTLNIKSTNIEIDNLCYLYDKIDNFSCYGCKLFNQSITEKDCKYYNKENINILKIIYQFKFNYFLLRFKTKFMDWMWRVREKKVMEKYSPENLEKLLSDIIDEDDMMNKLDSW